MYGKAGCRPRRFSSRRWALRRQNRRMREARKITITRPVTRSVPARPAAIHGWKIAKVTIPATPRSSAALSAMLLSGSGRC